MDFSAIRIEFIIIILYRLVKEELQRYWRKRIIRIILIILRLTEHFPLEPRLDEMVLRDELFDS